MAKYIRKPIKRHFRKLVPRKIPRKSPRKPPRKALAKFTVSKKTYLKMKSHLAFGAVTISALAVLSLLAWFIYSVFFTYRINIEDVKAMRIPAREITTIYEISAERSIDPVTALTAYCISNSYFPEKKIAKTKEQLERDFFPQIDKIKKKAGQAKFDKYNLLMETLMTEIKYFPIPEGFDAESYMFGDTWGTKRASCGAQNHRGTDLLDRENTNGRIPIVSISSGTVEKKAQIAKGNWQILIKSEKGTYYLYNNLDSLTANLEAGMSVTAGSPLGYMGNGNGKTENGKAPVGVHIAIRPETTVGKDFWMNPYPFLRYIEAVKAPRAS